MFEKLFAMIRSWFKPKPVAQIIQPPVPKQITPAGVALIKQFESCRLTSYQDGGGIWTIGWGHTEGIKEGMTCTQEQADAWFDQDIASISHIVNGLVPTTINTNQFSACVSLAYNIGTGRFAQSTLLQMIRGGNIQGASEQFPRWDRIDGSPDDGLLKRRLAEQQLFNTPVA
jgi:lysozyme